MTANKDKVVLGTGDALIVVDMQNDFLPGGRLAVPRGDELIPVLNRYLAAFAQRRLPIIATRDWHPTNHCSFQAQGGRWPVHCVAGTDGAAFAPGLRMPGSALIISKATRPDQEAYSGFEGTDLAQQLSQAKVRRLFVGGLATDYCVLNTVKDSLRLGLQTCLLRDAIRPVNVQPLDGQKAEQEMIGLGAIAVDWETLSP